MHGIQSRLMATILFAICLSITASEPTRAVNDCSDTTYVLAFDARMGGRSCREVLRIPIRSGGHAAWFRVLAADDVHAGPRVNQAIAWIREAAGRISAAMDVMGGLQLDDVTILLTNLPMPDIGGVRAWALVSGNQPYTGQCLSTAFEYDTTMDRDAAVFILSHEVFHCIQRATWPGSLAAVDLRWWVEGSAEYFAHLSIPGTHYHDGLEQAFVNQARSTSLLAFSYENVVFFSWLGGAHGAPAVKHFLDVVSSGRNRESYRAQAEAALGPDDWKDFATAFVSADIRLPGSSSPIGADWAALPRHTLGNGEELRLQAEPLVILAGVLVFHEARAHRIHTVATPGPYGASPDASHGSWRELPETLAAACHQEPTYFVAAMTASRSPETIHITDNAEEVPCDRREGDSGGNCIVGTWQMRSDSFANAVHNVLCPKHARSCDITSGGIRLTFDASPSTPNTGTGIYRYEGIAYRYELERAARVEERLDGTAHTRWSTVQNVLYLAFTDLLHEVGQRHTVTQHLVHHYNTPDVETKDVGFTPIIGFGPFLGGRYKCDPTSLHIDPPPGYQLGPEYSFDFTRVGGGPRGH